MPAGNGLWKDEIAFDLNLFSITFSALNEVKMLGTIVSHLFGSSFLLGIRRKNKSFQRHTFKIFECVLSMAVCKNSILNDF